MRQLRSFDPDRFGYFRLPSEPKSTIRKHKKERAAAAFKKKQRERIFHHIGGISASLKSKSDKLFCCLGPFSPYCLERSPRKRQGKCVTNAVIPELVANEIESQRPCFTHIDCIDLSTPSKGYFMVPNYPLSGVEEELESLKMKNPPPSAESSHRRPSLEERQRVKQAKEAPEAAGAMIYELTHEVSTLRRQLQVERGMRDMDKSKIETLEQQLL